MATQKQEPTGRKAQRMIRVDLTDEEWRRLRIEALRRNEPVQALASDVLRRAIHGWKRGGED